MRRAAKRDDNEALIVTALQSAGWTVVRVSDAGAPDLLVARNGVLTLMEVKGPKGTLTPAQEVAFERLAWAGVQVWVVRTPFEALNAVGAAFHSFRWVAQNGAFLCEHCWLPENGFHAKDCPSRTVLKPEPKVQSAHRAEKKMAEAMPKRDDGYRSMILGQQCAHPAGCPEMLMPGYEFCPRHRPSRGVEEAMPKVLAEGDASLEEARSVVAAARPFLGVEGELQPLKVKP